MAAGRKPGPLCSVREATAVEDGTTHPPYLSTPGPVGIGITYFQPQDRKFYESLSGALDRAVEQTPSAVFSETGISFGDNLTDIIPSIFKTLKVGSATKAADDVSESSSKKIPNPQTCTSEELIASLGLDFLPASIHRELDESEFVFHVGLSRLHNACSKKGTIRDFEVEKAAGELARAVGVLLHLILQRIVTYLQINNSPGLPRSSSPGQTALAGKKPNDEGIEKLVALLRSSALDDPFATWIQENWRYLLVNPRLRQRPRTGSAARPLDTDTSSARRKTVPASAADDSDDESSDDKTQLTYIEILVVDEENNPVNKGKYRLELTDGSIRKGDLPGDGRIRVDSIPPGTCDFRIFQMIEFGTPAKEIDRSWSWRSSQGIAFGRPEDAQFDSSGSEHLTASDDST
jgi:hypothetical protein